MTTSLEMDPGKRDLFLEILANVGTLLANPLLGLHGAGQVTVLLQLAGSVFRDIAAGVDELRAVDQQIRSLVEEGRAPSPEEWATWEGRLAAVDARFAKLRGG